MKKTKLVFSIGIFFAFLTLFFACQENGVEPELSDAALIEAIESASNKQIVSSETLPTGSINTLDEEYPEDFVQQAQLAPELGYEVELKREQGADVGQSAIAYFNLSGRELQADHFESDEARKRKQDRRRKDCFEFVLPVTITMPDGSTIVIESEEDWAQVKAWYEANPDVDERPVFNFPLEIVVGDSVITIESSEELHRAKEACKSDKRERDCFKIAFPHSLTMPDGTVITLESEEDFALVKEWYEANPDVKERPALVFPVDIEYADGTVVTINSEEELKRAKEECKPDRRPKDCFRLVFPFTLTMPDGSTITLEAEEDWEQVKAWYESHPDVEERPTLVFPVQINYGDDNIVTIENEEEMQAAKQACHDERKEGNRRKDKHKGE